MDVLASSEFRKVYAKLTRATKVTVNGHTIGIWMPAEEVDVVDLGPGASPAGILRAQRAYSEINSKPFTPVPKARGK